MAGVRCGFISPLHLWAMSKDMQVPKAPFLTLSVVLLVCTAALASSDTRSRKFDEFSGANWEDAMARLDNFYIALKNEPSSIGVFILYGGRRSRRNEAQAWGHCLKDYIVNRRGINANRIVIVNGGYRDSLTVEVWQSVSKKYIPTPTPAVDERDVRFRKGKIRRWRSLCNI
jgi:hypothetical protein